MLNRPYADPYIIAEIGVNHEGSLDRAKSMIASVARAGGHAAKFQTYKAKSLASERNSPAYWDTTKEPTTSQFELFSKLDSFGVDEYFELAMYCRELGVDFLSTPFDLESVEMLAPLMPAVKIASADLTNVPLLRAVARTGKPIILSVGASTYAEIDWALGLLEASGGEEIALLHCVLRYPTPTEHANLLGIKALEERYSRRATIGYSDHVAPETSGAVPALEMAAILGARVIEKHFTDDRSGSGNDHYHSIDELGLSHYVERLSHYRVLGGTGQPDIDSQSAAVKNARRRVFTARQIPAGTVLSENDLIPLRANTGLEVAHWDSVVGKVVAADMEPETPVTWGDLV